MRMKLAAGTALAGSLLISTFVWESAQATSAPDLKAAIGNSGTFTLVKHDGVGGAGAGGDGGRMAARGGDGDHGEHISGGDGGRMAARGGGDQGALHFKGGGNSRDRSYWKRNFNDGKYVRDHDNRHFTNRDRDHDHFNRHRVFRNGVWVWVYGPDYYAGGDCGWLLDRAEVTDSPYWWRRYNLCIGYY